MSIGGGYNIVTSREIQAIETYLRGSTKLTSSDSALKILKSFGPAKVQSPNSPSGYYVSTQADQVYEYFNSNDQYQKKIKKQYLPNYEMLKYTAISYCEDYDLF
jgi:hypothetical protein